MKNIQSIIILILLLVVLWLSQCQKPKGETKVNTVIQTDTIYKPIKYTEIRDTTIFRTKYLPQKIAMDTAAAVVQYVQTNKEIVLDYIAIRVYVDTIKIDSIGTVIIEDSVSTNQILSRNVTKRLNYSQYIDSKRAYKRSNDFYLGFSILGTTRQFNAVTGGILFTTKRNAYSVGFGIDENFNYLWKGSIYFKL